MKRYLIFIVFYLILPFVYGQEFIPTHWTTENLRMREDERITAGIISLLPKGTSVRLLKIGKTETIDNITASWVFVQLRNGTNGWCFSGYLSEENISNEMIIGTWLTEETYYVFTREGEFSCGLLEGAFMEYGTWKIIDNKISFSGEAFAPGLEDEDTTFSVDIEFVFLDEDTLQLFHRYNNTLTPTVYKRTHGRRF